MTTQACAINVRGLRVVMTTRGSGVCRPIAERLVGAGAVVHITHIDGAAAAEVVAASSRRASKVGDASSPRDADRVLANVVRFGRGLEEGPACQVDGAK